MVTLDQAYQAQISVIGSMLIDARCVPLVLSKLSPEDFIDGTCRATFTAIRKLVREGRPVDPVTVVDAMRGGDRYIAWTREAMAVTPTAANVGEYIPMVRDYAAVYRFRELCQQGLECKDIELVRELARQMASTLSAADRMPRMTAAERADDFYRRMKSEEKPKYLPWGIPAADRAVYAELGDMILLGGYASSGKTLLSIAMAMAQAKAGYKVGYYSLETSARKVTDRQIAALTGVPLGRIKTRGFTEDEWRKFAQGVCDMSSVCPFDVIPAAGLAVDDITADAIGHGYQIIYVDYVQLVRAPGVRSSDRYAVVTAVSQGFKTFAQSTGTAVVALAQLSRPEKVQVGRGENKKTLLVPPSMNSFRESGQLEQDADVAFLVWPKDSKDNNSNRIFEIGKNKEGPRPKVELVFHGDTQTMVELAPSVAAELSAQGRAIKQANRNRAQRAQQVEFRELWGEDDDNPFAEE